MPSATKTVTIYRPASEVFAFFTNPANDPKWRTHVKEIDALGSPAVGQTIRQVVEGPGGRSIPADIRITAYEPDARYEFEVIAGPVRPSGRFAFVAREGETDVTFTLSAELTGAKKLLMGRAVQKSMDEEMASLEKARHLLDAGL